MLTMAEFARAMKFSPEKVKLGNFVAKPLTNVRYEICLLLSFYRSVSSFMLDSGLIAYRSATPEGRIILRVQVGKSS